MGDRKREAFSPHHHGQLPVELDLDLTHLLSHPGPEPEGFIVMGSRISNCAGGRVAESRDGDDRLEALAELPLCQL